MLSKLQTGVPSGLSLKFIKSYLDCGDLDRARQLFNRLPEQDLYSWTILISAYTKHGFPMESIELYTMLRRRNVEPDKIILLSVAKACGASKDLIIAKEIHAEAMRFGLCSDLPLGNALIDMYGKCEYLEGAQRVFEDLPVKDVISWTSISSCYINCGLPRLALQVIRLMGFNGVKPNSVTLSSILPACSDLKDLNSGREIHGFVVRNGMAENVFVSSGLVDMYANCLCIQEAQIVFYNMTRRDVVSWNSFLTAYFSNGEYEQALSLFQRMRTEGVTMNAASWNAVIGGCIRNGKAEEAFKLLPSMQYLGFKPNHITIISVLQACSNLESLRGGMETHGYSFRHWVVEDTMTATALIFMYAKCGELEFSRRVFNMLNRRDTVTWNTMIAANSMHGNGDEALSLFHKMIDSGIKPNSVTFVVVLSGCSHSKLVDEGRQIFSSMSTRYFIKPNADHYSCMVDVLSRAGCLEEAYDFIQKMPTEPTASAWGALLNACRVYTNVELGRIAANRLFEIEPENPGTYVSLSNILVAAKLWTEASEIRNLMRNRRIKKMPGCSWVQVKNRVYTFVVGDRRNDHSDEIYKFLHELEEKMKLAGYLPDTDFVLQDVNQEEKEEVLCGHSEKLAVAFGILNLMGESTVRVYKNLRICGDCHNAIKFMAKIVGVQISVRDSLRFHHFRDGVCSCRDFW